jgi:hypothetical protein
VGNMRDHCGDRYIWDLHYITVSQVGLPPSPVSVGGVGRKNSGCIILLQFSKKLTLEETG